VFIVDLCLEVRGEGALVEQKHSLGEHLQPVPFKFKEALVEFL